MALSLRCGTTLVVNVFQLSISPKLVIEVIDFAEAQALAD
jgi:hypothetical protein